MADKENAATTKATELESLPMEIHTDIFSRLDAKTLARSRCVSKPFSTFVSSSHLISAHRIRSRKNPLLLFFIKPYGSDSHRLVSLDTTTMTTSNISLQNRDLSIPFAVPVLTCLELVCVHDRENGIYVFNPTNNYRKALPPSDRDPTELHPDGWHIVSVGFGYVRSTNQYKVVRIGQTTSTMTIDHDDADSFGGTITHYGFTEVFTIGTDEKWRDIEKNPPPYLEYFPPAVVNESLYYLSTFDFVSKFDLEREEWSILPSLPFAPESTRHIKELGGNLCLVTPTGLNSHLIDVWILKDFDTYSWAKVYHIDISSLFEYIYPSIEAYPLNIEEDGRLLLFLSFSEEKLVYYDPKNGDLEEINLSEKLSLGYDDSVSAPPTFYVDSFLSFDD